MNWYYKEKIDTDHYWGLKGQIDVGLKTSNNSKIFWSGSKEDILLFKRYLHY